MSYIAPNSDIYLLSGVPLDMTYEHTIWFANETAQHNYFSGKTTASFTKQYYQRVNRGTLRVQANANALYTCNYLMFRNVRTGTPNKWFYAFIASVEYVNENTTEIAYVIDVMQTWYFDYTLKQCFVERNHVSDDTIGSNTIPENLEIGPYITKGEVSSDAGNLAIHLYIYSTENPKDFGEEEFDFNNPAYNTGFPNPCYSFDVGGLVLDSDATMAKMRRILDAFATNGKSDAVVGIFILPKEYKGESKSLYSKEYTAPQRQTSVTVKNNKLYTYPYTCLTVTGESSSVILRYENFIGPSGATDDNTPNIKVLSNFGPGMQMVAMPEFYEGQAVNVEYPVTITKFPTLPYIKNYFQNWLAQNRGSLAVSIAGTALTVGVGIATGGAGLVAASNMTGAIATAGFTDYPRYGSARANIWEARQNQLQTGYNNQVAQGLSAGAVNVAGTLGKVYDASIVPDSIVGNAQAPDVMFMGGYQRFYFRCKTIKPEYTRIVDDYFSKYGYAIHRVQVPKTHVRNNWTFVKTQGCVIDGSCPADAERTICQIFDKGITFWSSGNNVGNYGDMTNAIIQAK